MVSYRMKRGQDRVLWKGTQAGRWSGLIGILLGRLWKCYGGVKEEEEEMKFK